MGLARNRNGLQEWNGISSECTKHMHIVTQCFNYDNIRQMCRINVSHKERYTFVSYKVR